MHVKRAMDRIQVVEMLTCRICVDPTMQRAPNYYVRARRQTPTCVEVYDISPTRLRRVEKNQGVAPMMVYLSNSHILTQAWR